MTALTDSFGRPVTYLRVSVIDRCNLRCNFCMPLHGLEFYAQNELLSFDEILLALRVAARLGVDRARLTGGEPLLRPHLPELIRRIKAETGIRQVAMTTNALLLKRDADALVAAGLDWINVSLESLDPARYHAITRFGLLETVWEGIRRVAEAGLPTIKINTVIVKGQNDDEFAAWLDLLRAPGLAEHTDLIVRFLEVMPIGEVNHNGGLEANFVNLSKVRDRLVAEYGFEPASVSVGSGPARYWRLPGTKGRIGFITPISDHYCDTCNRFRLTAIGELRPCLAYDTEVSIRAALQAGDEAAVEAGFREAARLKPRGHEWTIGQQTVAAMSSLGG